MSLIDRVRARMASHPGESCFAVAAALGERRVPLVAVMMRMVTLAQERASVRAAPPGGGVCTSESDGAELNATLRASRPVQEDR